jgi:hypothetical protein
MLEQPQRLKFVNREGSRLWGAFDVRHLKRILQSERNAKMLKSISGRCLTLGFVAFALSLVPSLAAAQKATIDLRSQQGCAPGGQLAFAVSHVPNKQLTVTIKITTIISGTTTTAQKVVYLPAGGEEFVGCTIDGPGPYAYRRYTIVGIQ